MHTGPGLLLVILLGATACGGRHESESSSLNEACDPFNNPTILQVTPKRLRDLPTYGALSDDKYPWSGDYWPTWKGGIAQRWQEQTLGRGWQDYQYRFYPREMLFSGRVNVERLSPAEKYDLLMGRYDFPLAAAEFAAGQRHLNISGEIPRWHGLCHGLAPATLLEPEPGAGAVMTNADGLAIPFYSADIKALLSRVYADEMRNARQAGRRCNVQDHALFRDPTGRIVQPECRDVNPALLHLALTQLITERNEGFIIDITESQEVWNQAVTGFQILEQQPSAFDPQNDPQARYRAPGTASLAYVRLQINYAFETASRREPVLALRQQYTKSMQVAYTLELAADGTIIGGEWVSVDRPDFIWRIDRVSLAGNSRLVSYEKVREILAASLR